MRILICGINDISEAAPYIDAGTDGICFEDGLLNSDIAEYAKEVPPLVSRAIYTTRSDSAEISKLLNETLVNLIVIDPEHQRPNLTLIRVTNPHVRIIMCQKELNLDKAFETAIKCDGIVFNADSADVDILAQIIDMLNVPVFLTGSLENVKKCAQAKPYALILSREDTDAEVIRRFVTTGEL